VNGEEGTGPRQRFDGTGLGARGLRLHQRYKTRKTCWGNPLSSGKVNDRCWRRCVKGPRMRKRKEVLRGVAGKKRSGHHPKEPFSAKGVSPMAQRDRGGRFFLGLSLLKKKYQKRRCSRPKGNFFCPLKGGKLGKRRGKRKTSCAKKKPFPRKKKKVSHSAPGRGT